MEKKLSRAEKKAENERAIAEMEDAMREAGTPLGNVGKATPALSKDKTEGAGESRAQIFFRFSPELLAVELDCESIVF